MFIYYFFFFRKIVEYVGGFLIYKVIDYISGIVKCIMLISGCGYIFSISINSVEISIMILFVLYC